MNSIKYNSIYNISIKLLLQSKVIKENIDFTRLLEEMEPEPPHKVKHTHKNYQEVQTITQIIQADLPQKQKVSDKWIINPYKTTNKDNKEMDYDKILTKFGCFPINQDIIKKIQNLTGKPAHYLIRRGIFYAHRDLDLILNCYEQHKNNSLPPFYLYTGRGPSSQALHLGHMLPFIFNKYLQQAFNVPLVIQISDDEKYFWKQGEDLQYFQRLAYDNIKDIIALGFDPQKTFIFIDTQYVGKMYSNVVRMQKNINLTTLKAIFGLDFKDNIGKASYPAVQAAPCLSSSFPHLFGKKNISCLIPCGIDQDPYFRMARDACNRIKAPKPAGFYSKFFPSLQGFQTKMAASNPTTGIFMTDTPQDIEIKINQYAFSGRKEQKDSDQKCVDLSVDIPYYYLTFFLEDDNELQRIAKQYENGEMSQSQIKKILIDILQKFVKEHQERRKTISDKDIKKFLSTHERKFVYI